MEETSRYLKIIAEKFFASERYIQALDLLEIEKLSMQGNHMRRLETYREVVDFIDEQLHAKLYGNEETRNIVTNLTNSIAINRRELKMLETKNRSDEAVKTYANKIMQKTLSVLESVKEKLPEERIGARIDLLRNLGRLLLDITIMPESDGAQQINKKALKELFTYLNDEEYLSQNKLL